MEHRAGFVNIIGYPNVGKSTLMNALVGEKLSIINAKAQTTRHLIHGILNEEYYQIIFSDTPGILEPQYKLQEKMMGFVNVAMEDADIFVIMIELGQKNFEEKFIEKINRSKKPLLILINKIDKLTKNQSIEEIIQYWKNIFPSSQILPISALHKFNMEHIIDKIVELLPVHPPYYPKDQLTDKNLRFFIAEIIREKILSQYKKEVPYSTEVIIEEYKEEDDIIRIKATIFVARESQKMILLGKGGHAIKRLGTASREEIEKFVDKHIFIDITVKVKKNWRNDDNLLKKFGYSFE